MKILISPLVPLLGLFLIGQARAQDGPVTGKEIQETWVGKEMIGSSGSGIKVYVKLEADGKASFTAGGTSDTGSWRPAEYGYCTTWHTVRAGQERCFTVSRSGSRFKVANPDGSLSGYFTGSR